MWSDKYIGIPYADMNCGALVNHVMRAEFGIELNLPVDNSGNIFSNSATVTNHKDSVARRIITPFDGCGVLMLARGRMAHVGVYVAHGAGFVLHAHSGFKTSVCQPIGSLHDVIIEGFYQWI